MEQSKRDHIKEVIVKIQNFNIVIVYESHGNLSQNQCHLIPYNVHKFPLKLTENRIIMLCDLFFNFRKINN